MLLIEGLSSFEQSFAEAEICYFENSIIDENVLGLNVSMDNVELIDIFKGIQNLFEVAKYIFFTFDLVYSIEMPEIAIEILIVTVLKDEVDSMVLCIPYDILDNDYVGVPSEPNQILNLLSCEGHNFIDFLGLLDIVGNANNLKGKFVYPFSLLALIVAHIDFAVGPFSKQKVFILGIVIAKLFLLAFDDFMIWIVNDPIIAVKITLAMVDRIGEILHFRLVHHELLLSQRQLICTIIVYIIWTNKMIASQQSYSGSIAESLAFDDDENTAQTPTFKVNVLSFKHIPRAFSRSFSDFGDMNIDDSVHHQSPEHPNKAYKCYKCFGRKTGDDIFIKISKCRQCEGSQYIGQNHPIVSIMEQIIKKKIPSLPKRQQQQKKQQKKVETLQLQYGCRDAIKEQSFSYQEQAVHCNSCKKQCDFNCYHTCQKCGDYNICQNCFKKKRFSHIHPLVLKDISKMPSRMSFMPSNLKINLDPQSSLQQSNKNECCNCREPIDICYEVCVDCEKKGINYIICNKCCQDKQYKHNPYHELQLRTLSQLSQINCIQSNSSIAHQNLELNSISNNISQHKSKNKVNNDWLNSSLEQSQNLSNPFENYMPEEVHFDLSDNLLEDDLFVFKSKQSKTEENIPSFECQQESRIQYNSSQMKVNLSSSFYLQKDREKPTAYDISFEPNQRNPQAAYLFNGYQCDICGVQPIKNRRFHCKQCQDYDLCQMCFYTQSKSHRHIHFQEIDGQQLLRQRESILKSAKSKIQQLGNSARLKHSLHLKQI